MINYSIIVPHKDIPVLLQRCLNSIPIRDDVQVIVVDDNSNPQEVDFAQFPRWEGKHYERFFTKEGQGAGFARNVGLKHATGKWLLFADADDFFTEDFGNLMDEMVEAEEDLIFFDHRSVFSADPSVSVSRAKYLSTYISDYIKGNLSETALRTRVPIPSCKIIRRSLVEDNHIRFSETHWGNDIYFSAQVASFAKRIRVTDMIGYVLTVRDGSLVSDFCGSRREVLERLQETLKADRCFARHNIQNPNKLSDSYLLITYRKHGFRWCLWSCLLFIVYPREACALFNFLQKRVNNKLAKYLKSFHK